MGKPAEMVDLSLWKLTDPGRTASEPAWDLPRPSASGQFGLLWDPQQSGPAPDTRAGTLEPSPYGGMPLMWGEGVREGWHFKFIQLLHFRPRPSGKSSNSLKMVSICIVHLLLIVGILCNNWSTHFSITKQKISTLFYNVLKLKMCIK